jgi:hypothetical protein
MPFGFASAFPGSFEYITFFRHPVERTVSEYYAVRQDRSNPAYAAARQQSMLRFVEGNHGSSNDCYTRWLSNAAFGRTFANDAQMLDAALINLARFSFIGITEAFETSVDRLCQKYMLVPYRTTVRHRSSATPATFLLSKQERRVIEIHNMLDLVVYNWASLQHAGAANPAREPTNR